MPLTFQAMRPLVPSPTAAVASPAAMAARPAPCRAMVSLRLPTRSTSSPLVRRIARNDRLVQLCRAAPEDGSSGRSTVTTTTTDGKEEEETPPQTELVPSSASTIRQMSKQAAEDYQLEDVDLKEPWVYNEIINGRLAMMGFIGAIAGEFASTDDIIEEFELDPLWTLFWVFVVTLTSYVGPELLVDEEERRSGRHERGVVSGDFAALLEAERINGRLAMVGFTVVLCIELLKGDNFEFFPWLEDELFLELPKSLVQFVIETGRGLKNNQANWIEDSYLGLLTSVTFFCFGQMFAVSRKSKVRAVDGPCCHSLPAALSAN